MSECFLIGEIELDVATGELSRTTADGRRETERLPPQPARLLAMLAAKRGELLGRDEIRAALWPDVQVDFDRALNFAIRQIRAALGDTAAEPRWIETLPRRGYRLLQPVRPLPADADAGLADADAGVVTGESPLDPGARDVAASSLGAAPRPSRRWIGGLAALFLIAATLLAVYGRDHRAAEPPPRIGIMPFEPPAGFALAGDPSRIAEHLLLRLTAVAGGGERAAILGPRSTGPHAGGTLRGVIDGLALDHLVNGRFLDDEKGPRLLVELIRGSDGAHVWVEAYDDVESWREIADQVADQVIDRLELEPRELTERQ